MITKIITGGQTGVDRAALDVGLKFNILIGGSCPKGRLAEDGKIDLKYPLQELPSPEYHVRTRKNVEDSDGILILAADEIMGGTALTKTFADELQKPCLILDLNQYPSPSFVIDWLKIYSISILNIAGPRESTAPGIYALSYNFLIALFQILTS